MKRREFLAATGAAGAASLASTVRAADAPNDNNGRRWVEIRTYWAKEESAKERLLATLDATVVRNRKKLGFEKVGLFTVNARLHADDRGFDPRWNRAVILTADAASLERLAGFHDDVLEKIEPSDRPAFNPDDSPLDYIDVSLHRTFPGCPAVEIPTRSADRVVQLRRYYSPNLDRNRAKRNMFDVRGEIDLFRRCAMAPVFFSETVFGTTLPNVTYMLAFENDDARRAGWKKFVEHPEWKQMSGEKEFENTATRILNLFLQPAPSSDI